MSQAEYIGWCAFFAVEGWPEWRADLRAADGLALLANVNRDKETRREPYRPSDFVRDWWAEPVKESTPEPTPARAQALLMKFRMLTGEESA